MPVFGKMSFDRLNTCDPDLILVATSAIKVVDFSIIWGHRGEEDQTIAYKTGHSNAKWPESRHNKTPSEAFDFLPYPFDQEDWRDIKRFTYVAGIIMGCASVLGVKLTYGGDWLHNGMDNQRKPYDYGHIQLI